MEAQLLEGVTAEAAECQLCRDVRTWKRDFMAKKHRVTTV